MAYNPALTDEEHEELQKQLIDTMREYFASHTSSKSSIRFVDSIQTTLSLAAVFIMAVPAEQRDSAIAYSIQMLETLYDVKIH